MEYMHNQTWYKISKKEDFDVMKSKKSVRDGKPVVIKLTSKGSLASIQYLKQAIEDGVLP